MRALHDGPQARGGTRYPRALDPPEAIVGGGHKTALLRVVPAPEMDEQRGPTTMATDYDTPRRSEADEGEDSLEELKARRAEAQSASVDVDETELAESLELPGADLSGEELTVKVLPKQSDEFTCSSCFLVHHRSQLASDKGGRLICRECA